LTKNVKKILRFSKFQKIEKKLKVSYPGGGKPPLFLRVTDKESEEFRKSFFLETVKSDVPMWFFLPTYF